MGLEGMEQGLRRVPNEAPKLNPNTYEARSLAERMAGFTAAESEAYQAIVAAPSLGELRSAIDAFNGVSTPKEASELGLSLADMEINGEPISVGALDLPEDAQVVAYRDMREKILRFRIIDKR
jgi:hypothetical protein